MTQKILLLGVVAFVAATSIAGGGESEKIRLGLFTAMPEKWDLETNWRVFESTFKLHAERNIDLVATPECFLDGYAASAKDWTQERFAAIAQDLETSEYIAKVRGLAAKHRTAILFGFTENAGGKFYNCSLMIGKDGELIGHYHKTHLQNHDLRFSAGESIPVFDMEWGKTGVLICADRRWPETARVARLKGARITVIPSYGMWHTDNEWWMRTRSYENENFLAFIHPNVAFVSDPRGKILAKLQSNVPGMLVTDVDLSEVSDDKHIRDRRPELYEQITVDK